MANENKIPSNNENNDAEAVVTLSKAEYDELMLAAAQAGANDPKSVGDKWYVKLGNAARRAGHAVLVGLGTGVLVYAGAKVLGLGGHEVDTSDDDIPDVDDN